ncbi:hypothetical protein FNL39_102451 [Nocardia caishijiensis]|uniref:Uncharacterized protein n=1 Tax=Nocardia caishijiensis TaxID=184756 RepID=A0ABQ6YRB0_9NOCA|nr:hypothetical protein FNL39_102451 [Nocardia caishijiensis]
MAAGARPGRPTRAAARAGGVLAMELRTARSPGTRHRGPVDAHQFARAPDAECAGAARAAGACRCVASCPVGTFTTRRANGTGRSGPSDTHPGSPVGGLHPARADEPARPARSPAATTAARSPGAGAIPRGTPASARADAAVSLGPVGARRHAVTGGSAGRGGRPVVVGHTDRGTLDTFARDARAGPGHERSGRFRHPPASAAARYPCRSASRLHLCLRPDRLAIVRLRRLRRIRRGWCRIFEWW